jgi:hypothetical protein
MQKSLHLFFTLVTNKDAGRCGRSGKFLLVLASAVSFVSGFHKIKAIVSFATLGNVPIQIGVLDKGEAGRRTRLIYGMIDLVRSICLLT